MDVTDQRRDKVTMHTRLVENEGRREESIRMESEMVVTGAIVDSWVETSGPASLGGRVGLASRSSREAEGPGDRGGRVVAGPRPDLAGGSEREPLPRQPSPGRGAAFLQRLRRRDATSTGPVSRSGTGHDRAGLGSYRRVRRSGCHPSFGFDQPPVESEIHLPLFYRRGPLRIGVRRRIAS